MPVTLRLLLALLLLLSSIGLPAAASADRLSLRVLTWNVWDVPVVATHTTERMRRIVPALAALEPDLVALQEVWVEEDAAILLHDLHEAGFEHTRHYRGEGMKCGLLIASRYPFRDLGFHAFVLGTTSHVPWHIDWNADKGVARVRVQTPLGDVDFADTHMQANYSPGGYLSVRLGQALEVAGVASAPANSGPPLIVAGDFNTRSDDLPMRVLLSRANLGEAGEDVGVDKILFRGGTDHSLRMVSMQSHFSEPVDLGDGVEATLSDHDAVVVDFELSSCAGCAAPGLRSQGWPAVLQEAHHVALDNLASRRVELWVARLGGLLLLLLVSFVVMRRRHLPRSLRFIGAGAALVLASWLAHFALNHGPEAVFAHETMVADLELDEPGGEPHH